ncbi:MAG TPA: sulfotransferase [Gaiellaceae bacterium]|nr:sulfotransferase [Gaiellaceae bacterium]
MSAVIVLGVSRSGTTLLKSMLDAHSQLAIPTESYFIPQLWDRHGERPDRNAILADLRRLERIRQWGIDVEALGQHLPAEPSFAQVIDGVYSAYAESQGKARYGDKTPLYMQHLELLARVFPNARYVHIVRDGRDAALSFLGMTRRPRFNVSRPRAVGDFAAAWRREILAARRFGREHPYLEVRYEELVADPGARLRAVCSFLGLAYEPTMLEYHRAPDLDITVDHVLLAQPPASTARKWREQMAERDVELFEAIAGDVLSELGYERAHPHPGRRARAAAERAVYAARVGAWRAVLPLVRKSPAWRLRQVYIRRAT